LEIESIDTTASNVRACLKSFVNGGVGPNGPTKSSFGRLAGGNAASKPTKSVSL
jgi:hypothetical protein